MKRENPTRATVLATGLFIGGLLCGATAGRAAVARVQDPYAHLDLFARVLTTIQDDYVEPVSSEVLVDAAIRGMMDELDSQSRWLDADQLRDLRDDAEGATTGIGIEVRRADDGVQVLRVLPDSPAGRDGLAPGDRILEVDGEALAGLPLGEIRERFDGALGEQTRLTVLRDGWDEPRTIETTRDRVHRDSAAGELLDGRVIYVHLDQFQEGSADDLKAEVERLSAPFGGPESIAGLVLDLRDNPGGLLSQAVAVTDLFLDDGVMVSTRGRRPGDTEVHRATPGGFPPELKVVLLVNGMSASASEIVAGALQDTGRGVLVGERTYGKGTVQQVYLHASPDESALKITVGRYYTPSGEPVATREGRRPDHEVPYPREPTRRERLAAGLTAAELPDDQRAALLDLVAGLPADEPQRAIIPWDRSAVDRLATDPQLQRAVELLRP